MISKSIRKKPNRGYFTSTKRERISVLNKKVSLKRNLNKKNELKPKTNNNVTKYEKPILNKLGNQTVANTVNKKEPTKVENIDNMVIVNHAVSSNKINERPSDIVAMSKNKIENINNNMNVQTLEEINDIINDDSLNSSIKKTRKKVKIEKKEKGLFEKTEDSAILITEDNKTLLTD